MNKYLTYFRERECYVAQYSHALPKEEEVKKHLKSFAKNVGDLNLHKSMLFNLSLNIKYLLHKIVNKLLMFQLQQQEEILLTS